MDSAEVAQQSRIRHKEDFIIAFSPVVAEATSIAYKGAPTDVQAKLRRVVDVWKDRTIFEPPIQAAIESRLDGKAAFYLPNKMDTANIIPQSLTRPGGQQSTGSEALLLARPVCPLNLRPWYLLIRMSRSLAFR